jgi:hypothetical protein
MGFFLGIQVQNLYGLVCRYRYPDDHGIEAMPGQLGDLDLDILHFLGHSYTFNDCMRERPMTREFVDFRFR